LPARYVIHTVGPVYGEAQGREAELLRACYQKSLALAAQHELHSVGFPAISTGVYSYPLDEAARVASRAIEDALANLPSIAEVRLVFFQPADANAFLQHQAFSH
jgi:O-acetyl-ADP-ribose deacetylase (regulator of RNase III)